MPASASEFGKGALRGAFCLALLACPAAADPVLDALTSGAWGNDSFPERHCTDNPHRVRLLSSDRLAFDWPHPIRSHLTGEVRHTEATILSRGPEGLELQLDHETRIDEDAAPLRFDLWLTERGQAYCLTPRSWHRSACPMPYERCPGIAGS